MAKLHSAAQRRWTPEPVPPPSQACGIFRVCGLRIVEHLEQRQMPFTCFSIESPATSCQAKFLDYTVDAQASCLLIPLCHRGTRAQS